MLALALDDCMLDAQISGTCLSNWRFVDDISLFAERDIDLQTLIHKVHGTSGRCELVLSGTRLESSTLVENSRSTSSWEMELQQALLVYIWEAP